MQALAMEINNLQLPQGTHIQPVSRMPPSMSMLSLQALPLAARPNPAGIPSAACATTSCSRLSGAVRSHGDCVTRTMSPRHPSGHPIPTLCTTICSPLTIFATVADFRHSGQFRPLHATQKRGPSPPAPPTGFSVLFVLHGLHPNLAVSQTNPQVNPSSCHPVTAFI